LLECHYHLLVADVEEMNRQLKQELMLIELEIQQQSTAANVSVRSSNAGEYSGKIRRQLPSDPQLAAVKR